MYNKVVAVLQDYKNEIQVFPVINILLSRNDNFLFEMVSDITLG